MRKIVFFLILTLHNLGVWSVAADVTTTGFGPTQKEALMAAHRRAVEQGVGVLVDSHSATQNMMLLEDKIYTKARGYVEHYTIISEAQQADGTWRVEIQCQVAAETLKQTLIALGILRQKMGNPRIMVFYQPEVTDNTENPESPIISEAYEGIVEQLTTREFPVVAQKEFALGIISEFSNNSIPNSNVRVLGLKNQAEYVLIFNLKASSDEKTGLFYKGRVMISAKIINTATGQILAAQSNKAMGADKDSIEFAYRKAGRNAGKLTASFLENKLAKIWVANTSSGRPVVLEVANIRDFSSLVDLGDLLKETHGVEDIVLRSSTPSSIQYEVSLVGEVDTLKNNTLDVLKRIGLRVKNSIANGDRLRLELTQ